MSQGNFIERKRVPSHSLSHTVARTHTHTHTPALATVQFSATGVGASLVPGIQKQQVQEGGREGWGRGAQVQVRCKEVGAQRARVGRVRHTHQTAAWRVGFPQPLVASAGLHPFQGAFRGVAGHSGFGKGRVPLRISPLCRPGAGGQGRAGRREAASALGLLRSLATLFPRVVGCPQCQVVSQQLHDEGAVLVGVLAEGVQVGHGLVEGGLGQ